MITANRLILFRDILYDAIIHNALKLINNANNNNEKEELYFSLQSALLQKMKNVHFCGSYWQGYLAFKIASSENAFSLGCETEIEDEDILKIAIKDFEIIKKLYNVDWSVIAESFGDADSSVFLSERTSANSIRKKIHDALTGQDNISGMSLLKEYYAEKGCGIFERYDAFKWNEDKGLSGIESYDPITFEDLTGYEKQKNQLIENTEFFLKGMKANNILLYGDRGTGKSSSVKALLNKYKNKKLKMIEIKKEQFYCFPDIINSIKKRGYKFVIFIDDLSFEDFETDYKHFKAVIEGGLEVRPQNVVIYATSNRRNIIKETWKDQAEINGDVHISDSIQEKVSLADRFGITITYPAPDKNLFLKIVMDLAHNENLNMDKDALLEEALKWEMRYHGRSGRSARQFIDYMTSKMNQ